MATVRHILQTKGKSIWSVAPEASVYDALRIMAEKNVGALLVISEGRLAGIFSERDYARKFILQGEASQTTAVKDVMTSVVVFVRPEQSIEECMALMTEKRIRHLPVFEGGQLAGVISIGDVVKEIISDQQQTIQHLENYITGKR
ncbi:MAG TPA: CBS domain-containing protein [Bacteroidota bacterium]|nr:CBS domain-containing protein [Bacteroidota bacterium]